MRSHFEQSLSALLSWLQVALREQVLAPAGLIANVEAPAQPFVAFQQSLSLAQCRKRLFAFACMHIVATQVDNGIDFGFKHLVPTRDFNACTVMLDGMIEVLKLAMNPSDGIRYLRRLIAISVAPSRMLHQS